MNIFTDIDLAQNYIKKATIEHLTDFPSGARTGRVFYHETLVDFFFCKHGFDLGGDTTIKGNWISLKTIEKARLSSEGIGKGKILVTDGAGGFDYDDVDGGTL